MCLQNGIDVTYFKLLANNILLKLSTSNTRLACGAVLEELGWHDSWHDSRPEGARESITEPASFPAK